MGSPERFEQKISVLGCGGNGQLALQILSSMGYNVEFFDGDTVEKTDLRRQSLFSIEDVGKNKARVCMEKIHMLNGSRKVMGIGEYVDSNNIDSLLGNSKLIIDATDSFITRELLNEFSIKRNIPMIFSSSFGNMGQIKCIIPGKTSCLHCLTGGKKLVPLNCHYDRVDPFVPQIISSNLAAFADFILSGRDITGDLYIFNFSDFGIEKIKVNRNMECEVCVKNKYNYLESEKIVGRQLI